MVWQQEHRLIYEDFIQRYRIVVGLFCLFFLALSVRLFVLQIIGGDYYRTVSEQQRTHVIPERGPRGIIYDFKGNVLAGNKTGFVALFYPFAQTRAPSKELVEELKEILGKDLSVQIHRGWKNGQVVRLADNLTREEMFRLQEKRLVLPGISVVREARREYPDAEANSHLIGYLNEITPSELEDLSQEGYRAGEWMGRGGLEKFYNNRLRGQDGGWEIEVDAAGHQTRLVRHMLPSPGSNLYTTIDSRLQAAAAEAMQQSPTGRGAVVAIDPNSGAIRALVSTPGYDPAAMKEFRKYLTDKRLPLFNRTVQALYAPGSTFKIVTMLAALTEGGVEPSSTYFCSGSFTLGTRKFACWFRQGHGALSLLPALANSCNVYFYQTGLKIGAPLIGKYARLFLLGSKTGIDMPSEKKGLVPTAEWKLSKMKVRWQQGDTVNMAIGQGAVWVTPLQMASLTAAVANQGTVYEPYLVDHIKDAAGSVVYRHTISKRSEFSVPERNWQLLHRGLRMVVEQGTGRGCDIPDLPVAGKTGTAQNPHGQDHAWFVSYAPADHPELAIAVIVENGGHGGTAAVPVARKLYETWFGLNKTVNPPEPVIPDSDDDPGAMPDNATNTD